MKNDFDTISNEKTALQNNVDDLTKTLENFVKSRDNLNMLLGNQRCVFDKAGIGYDSIKKQKNLNTIFEKAPLMAHPHITCHYCRKKSHYISYCPFKKNMNIGIKKIGLLRDLTKLTKKDPRNYGYQKPTLDCHLVGLF